MATQSAEKGNIETTTPSGQQTLKASPRAVIDQFPVIVVNVQGGKVRLGTNHILTQDCLDELKAVVRSTLAVIYHSGTPISYEALGARDADEAVVNVIQQIGDSVPRDPAERLQVIQATIANLLGSRGHP